MAFTIKTKLALALSITSVLSATALADIKIAHVYGKTGPFEAYAKQSHDGLRMGIEYATNGTFEINGEKIVIIEKDTQLKPELGRSLLEEAYADDDVVLAVGGVSSGVAMAMLPVAEEYEKILIVEPAVADSITGPDSNRYIFRTGRNSTQDAIANAKAIGRPGVKIVTLAQDYAFGRDGIAAFRSALQGTGAEIVHEEYAPTNTTDFTAVGQRIFDRLKDESGEKVVFFYWAGGGNPMGKLQSMNPERFDIKFATGGNILAALTAYKAYPGMEGATYYFYSNPQNALNQWLNEEHMKRFGTPPDMFTAGGVSAGIAVVEALKKAQSHDSEDLITAMRGMSWETPKGTMTFRKEDHQAMQDMYHFRVRVDDNTDWAMLDLVREIPASEMDIPIGRVNK